MKKRIVTILLCISCTALLFTGCSGSSSSSTETKVTLAEEDYKGIEVEETAAAEVTDEDVEDTIQSTLEENTVEVDGEIKDGYIANIDYTGTLDGEEFDGGSATDYDLEIGSDTFIDGFEDQLIGHKAGDEFDIEVTFPDDYDSEDLAGKDTVFSVKINSVSKIPELTDELVKELSETSETVDEYKEEIRAQLEEENEQDAEDTFAADVMDQVVANAEVSSYDEERLEELKEETKDYYEQIIGMYYGMDMDEYLEQMDQTEDDFDSEIEEQCKETLKTEAVCEYIAEQEGLTPTDEEYQEELDEMASENGYDDADTMIEEYASYYYADEDSDDSDDSSDDTDAETDDSSEESEDDESTDTDDADADTDDTDSEDSEDTSSSVSEEAIQKMTDELKSGILQEKVSAWLVENAVRVEASDDESSDDESSEDTDESSEDESSEDTEDSSEEE